MAAATYFAQVQQLYIAYFGRPADPIGQAYWAANIDAANGDISAVIAGFSASKESAELFGNKSTIDKVTAIYQNAFGRAPEPEGLAYWVAQLDSGKVSQAQASWTIQQNAGAGDAAVVQNKLTAAQAFTAKLDTTAAITGYQGADAAQMARDFLKEVTADNATATAAVEGAGAAIAAIVAVGDVGATFVLTSGTDVLKGTSGNDVFIGDATTTQAADQIDGGAGIDTFNLFGAGAKPVLPTMTNIERLVLTNPTAAIDTLDVSTIKDLTDVVLKGAKDDNVLTVGDGVTTTVDGSTTGVEVKFGATAVDATVALINGTTVDTLKVEGTGVKALNVASNGSAANTIKTLETTAATLNISGQQTLAIDSKLDATITTVDASTNTGGVSLNIGATANATVTGGAGNDTFVFDRNLTATDKVDGGKGSNTLSVTDGMSAFGAVKNIEVVKFTAKTTLNLMDTADHLTNAGVTKLLFNGAVANTITGADADHSFALAFAGAGEASAVTLATQVTAANISLEGTTLSSLKVTADQAKDAITVNIASTGAVNKLTELEAAEGSTFKVTGTQDLTITNLASKGTVDASALAGALTITGSTGADTIILGSGADTVNVQAKGSTYLAMDTITNFTKADALVLTGMTADALVKYDAFNDSSFEQAVLAAELAAGGAGKASYFTFDNNTYVVVDVDGTTSKATSGTADLVVKLTGVMDLVANGTNIHAVA